jgi:hypothetical protein
VRHFITVHVLDTDSYNTSLTVVAVDEILYLQQRPGFTMMLLRCGTEWEVQESVGEIAALLNATITAQEK